MFPGMVHSMDGIGIWFKSMDHDVRRLGNVHEIMSISFQSETLQLLLQPSPDAFSA